MRLTEVMKLFNDRLYQIPNNKTDYSMAVIKLGQLEDIEEELGIDLITLFKALKCEPHIALRRAIGYWQLKDLAGDNDLRTQDYGKKGHQR